MSEEFNLQLDDDEEECPPAGAARGWREGLPPRPGGIDPPGTNTAELSAFADEVTRTRDRIVILGRRGAGKTVFLARLYQELWRRTEGLQARALDGNAHQRFMECIEAMGNGHWPEATLAQRWADLELRYGSRIWTLRVLDYPGEVFRRAFVEGAEDEAADMLRSHVDAAAAVLVLIDPVAARSGSLEASVDAEFGMSAALRRVHERAGDHAVPVAVVLTKCDVALPHINEAGGARQYLESHLPGLVRDGGVFRVFASSAVRAQADALGTLRPVPEKDALGIVQPLQWCLKCLARESGGEAL